MKDWKRILSAMLVALLLCAPMSVAALAEADGASGEEGAEALEIVLEEDAQGCDGDTVCEDGARPLYEIDGANDADAPALIPGGEAEAAPAEPLPNRDGEAAQSNDASDFEISNGVLVKYKGGGGYVTIPDGVTVIGSKAFYECTSLTGVYMPSGVTTIKDHAFYNCANLVSISFPDALTRIEEYAFYGCTGLSAVMLPSTVTSIGEWAFSACKGMTDVYIPEGVATIGNFAFSNCHSLTRVTIPASATSVGAAVLSGCKSLEAINVASGNQNYTSVDGILYVKATHELMCCPGAKTYVSIPSGTTGIGYCGFIGCQYLTGVKIPTTVTYITMGAFASCVSLSEITIPESVRDIGYWAFYQCTSLKKVTIFATSIGIDEMAFDETNPVFYAYKGYDAYSWAQKQGFTVSEITSAMDPAKLSKTSVTLKVGKTATLKISGLAGRTVTWSTSNKSVATVKNGKITAKNGGKCTITAQIKGGKKLTCSVKVTDSLAISKKSLTIISGETATLKLTGLAGRTVTWSSANTGVVRIEKSSGASATLRGVRAGKAVVSAKINGGKTLKCTVTAKAPLTITKAKLLEKGEKDRKLQIVLNNQSKKTIKYIKLQIIQKNAAGRKLKSPYSYYFFDKSPIKPGRSYKGTCSVNKDTESVQFKILLVEYSDGTKWKP